MASGLSRATDYKKKQTAASKLASLRSSKTSLAGFDKTGNSNMIKSGASSTTIKKNIADANASRIANGLGEMSSSQKAGFYQGQSATDRYQASRNNTSSINKKTAQDMKASTAGRYKPVTRGQYANEINIPGRQISIAEKQTLLGANASQLEEKRRQDSIGQSRFENSVTGSRIGVAEGARPSTQALDDRINNLQDSIDKKATSGMKTLYLEDQLRQAIEKKRKIDGDQAALEAATKQRAIAGREASGQGTSFDDLRRSAKPQAQQQPSKQTVEEIQAKIIKGTPVSELTSEEIQILLRGKNSQDIANDPILQMLQQSKDEIISDYEQGEADSGEINRLEQLQQTRDQSRQRQELGRVDAQNAEKSKDSILATAAAMGGGRGTAVADRQREVDVELQKVLNLRKDASDRNMEALKLQQMKGSKDARENAKAQIRDIQFKMAQQEASSMKAMASSGASFGDMVNLMKTSGQNSGFSGYAPEYVSKGAGVVMGNDGNPVINNATGLTYKLPITQEDRPDLAFEKLADGSVVGLHKKTGDVMQRIMPDGSVGYNSPQLAYDSGVSLDPSKILQKLPRFRNTGNVANDLNNPSNLTKNTAAAKYADGYTTVVGQDGVTRDFLVFSTPEKGLMGNAADLQAKQSGGSSHINPDQSLNDLLDVWVGGEGAPEGYKNTVANTLGASLEGGFTQFDPMVLAKAIAKAEGFTGGGSIEIPGKYVQKTMEQADINDAERKMINAIIENGKNDGSIKQEDVYMRRKDLEAQARMGDLTGRQILRTKDIKKYYDTSPGVSQQFAAVQELINDKRGFLEAHDTFDNSGAGDQVLVFQFMKLLDPTSVVREGEFNTAASLAQSKTDKWKADYERVLNSGGIFDDPAAREEILDQMKMLFNVKMKSYGDFANKQRERISQFDETLPADYMIGFSPDEFDELMVDPGANYVRMMSPPDANGQSFEIRIPNTEAENARLGGATQIN